MAAMSLVPVQLIIRNDGTRKNRSPSCDIVKTFKPAFIVVARIDQNLIRKNETMLIISQRAIRLIKSAAMKKQTASCENNADNSTMFDPNTSYSKYSLRKAKQAISAISNIDIKAPDTASNLKIIAIAGAVMELNDSTGHMTMLELVTDKLEADNSEKESSEKSAQIHTDLIERRSNHRWASAQKLTRITPCDNIKLAILCCWAAAITSLGPVRGLLSWRTTSKHTFSPDHF